VFPVKKNAALYRLFQYSFYPAILCFTAASSLLMMVYMHPNDYIFIPGILMIVIIMISVVVEHIFPYRQAWLRNKGDVLSDFFQTFVILPTASKIAEFAIPIVLFYPITWLSSSLGVFKFSQEWGTLTHFMIALLACEFFYYWYHRIGHELPLLWRFHSVHHGAERVYWLNSGRFHVLDAFASSFLYFTPMLFLGTSPEAVILIITFSSVTGFMEHVNIDFKAGWLNYILNTAEHHRWHHSLKIVESNTNYGKVLIVWDLVFRTFHLPKDKAVQEVGIVGNPVSRNFFGQLIHPFKKGA